MKKIAMILVLLITAISGCKDRPSNGTSNTAIQQKSNASSSISETTHNLIIQYNALLSEGYKTTDMTKLQEVTTPELAQKAYYHMAAIGESKNRMVSELKKIDFIETDCSTAQKCSILTKEVWDFAYADIITGARSNEVKDYVYDVNYLAENRQGRWLITEITANGEERKEIPSWKEMFRKH